MKEEIIVVIIAAIYVLLFVGFVKYIITEHKAIMKMGKVCDLLLKERENNEKKI